MGRLARVSLSCSTMPFVLGAPLGHRGNSIFFCADRWHVLNVSSAIANALPRKDFLFFIAVVY